MAGINDRERLLVSLRALQLMSFALMTLEADGEDVTEVDQLALRWAMVHAAGVWGMQPVARQRHWLDTLDEQDKQLLQLALSQTDSVELGAVLKREGL